MSFNDKGLPRRIKLEITLKKKKEKRLSPKHRKWQLLLCVILYRSVGEKKKESKGNRQAGGWKEKKERWPNFEMINNYKVNFWVLNFHEWIFRVNNFYGWILW